MNSVIVFVKAPLPGKVKTRLCPPLSSARAAALYKAFAKDTVALVQRAAEVGRMKIAYIAEDPYKDIRWLNAPPGTKYFIQRGKDLGARLIHAFDQAFRSGASKVVVLGSDTPHLTPCEIEHAFDNLERSDVVIGPAQDGGYYLIGLRKPNARLFEDIPWSSSKVLQATLSRAFECKLSTFLLTSYTDVDTRQDLLQLINAMEGLPQESLVETRKVLAEISHAVSLR